MKVGDISNCEMQKLLEFAEKDERFGVAFFGALSQIRHRIYLESLGFHVSESQSDNLGAPDFIIAGQYTLEHKRAKKNTYSDGSLKAEFQKSRGIVPDRLYDSSFSDIVSADVSEHTGVKDDYRYALTEDLRKHHDYTDKIASIQKINEKWTNDLRSLMEVISESR